MVVLFLILKAEHPKSTSPTSNTLTDIVFGNSTFVAVVSTGETLTSSV